jgi:hypothetical protein
MLEPALRPGVDGFGSTMRLMSLNGRLRRLALYILAAKLGHKVGMLREDAPLQRVTLLASHLRHVERVGRLLVLGVLQLAAIDELHVGHGRPRLIRADIATPGQRRSFRKAS